MARGLITTVGRIERMRRIAAAACATVALGAGLGLALVRAPGPVAIPLPRIIESAPVASVADARGLAELLTALDYRLETLRAGAAAVPRVFLTNLPRDLGDLPRPDERKALFVRLILPLVLEANEAVMVERRRLERLAAAAARGVAPEGADRRWLADLTIRYRAEPGDYETLLRRVDAVPPSLALAQAALESGWGTSRLATENHALFGQRVFGGQGAVRSGAGKGAPVRFARFDDLRGGVRAYIRNLNSHWAYRGFRLRRAELRLLGGELSGGALAGTIIRYSERGAAYTRDVHSIIRANRLEFLDRARLVDGAARPVMLAGT